MNLNSEVENLRFRGKQCGAGFPACRFAGLSGPAWGDWKVALTGRQECLPHASSAASLTNFGIQDDFG